MSDCQWIVCERTNRWASALRPALLREFADGPRYRLREVRHIGELDPRLADWPFSFVTLEIHRGNLSDALAWLTAATRRFSSVRCAALLDRSLQAGEQARAGRLADICSALREAGAAEIAASPRRLQLVLELARRHARLSQIGRPMLAGDAPVTTLAWASLPWQNA